MSLEAVLNALDGLKPLGAGPLRALVDRAGDVVDLLELASEVAVALEDAPEMAGSLSDLEEHGDTLSRLQDLADLADEVERLGRVLRRAHGHRDELEWAIEQGERATAEP